MTPREYSLFLTRSQKFAIGLPLVMLLLIPVVFLFAFSSAQFRQDDAPPFFPLFPFGLFLIFAVLYASSVLYLPYRITVTRDRQIVFKSVLRSRSVRVADVFSIEPRNLNIQAGLSGYLLKHRDGKIRFPGQFTGQYLLLYELKQANPSLDLKGC